MCVWLIYYQGYSRQGLALFNLGRVPEAKASYEKGLEIDPNNAALKEGLSQVEQSQRAPANPFAAMFGPDIWVKIQTNPSIRHYLDDPQFVQNVRMLQSNPSLIQGMLGDSKIQQLLCVMAWPLFKYRSLLSSSLCVVLYC